MRRLPEEQRARQRLGQRLVRPPLFVYPSCPPTCHANKAKVNFRFTAETCLFGDDSKASEITGCLANDACLPLDGAIAFDDFEPDPEDTYGYCTAKDKSFLGKHTQSCLKCLRSSDNHVFVANCASNSRPTARGL